MDFDETRIFHILGGLRAVDNGRGDICVGVASNPRLCAIARPPKKQLYTVMCEANLQPIGGEIIYHLAQTIGAMPPTWETSYNGRTKAKDARVMWANIRADTARRGQREICDLAGRITTYLELLSIRIRQLSDAYNATLNAHLINQSSIKPGLFSTIYMVEIEAALHAFFADAASFRDLLAESCWRLVLRQGGREVTRMRTFLNKAKNSSDPIAQELVRAGAAGGWIKNLTDVRNDIVHVAPVAQSQEHSFCDLRMVEVDQDGRVPILHYPLTQKDGSIRRPSDRFVDYSEKTNVERSLEEYREFVKDSMDALENAWRTFSRLVELSESIRMDAGLTAGIPIITPTGGVRTHCVNPR